MLNTLRLYNTLTRKIEEVLPADGQTIRLYTCGPTVYNSVHIGNLRTYIMADILYRTLKFDGYDVEYVMNITDVDDKTIKGTIKEFGRAATVENLRTYTTRYLEGFLKDLESVNIDAQSIRFIRVADVIPQIQDFILELLDKGYAYHADDGVYFSIEKYQADFGDYGTLVGEKFLEGKKIGARVAVDEYDKDNLSDFALWKSHTEEDGNIYWDHDILGKGRPGWHIECSAINKIAFNNTAVDLHTGAVDLIFPHHTNEIAQSQPVVEKFVKHWMHPEHLTVQDEKMAKSKQNFYTLKDLAEKGFSGIDLRYTFLQSHYKTQQNFTWESIEASHAALSKLKYAASNLTAEAVPNGQEFRNSLNDDLNTAKALAAAWEDKNSLLEYDKVLGLRLSEVEVLEIPDEIQSLVDERQQARDNKDFSKSDEIREQIETMGYTVKDTNSGQIIQRK